MRWVAVLVAAGSIGCLEVNSAYLIDPPPRADEAISLIKAKLGGGSFDAIYWYGPKSFAECPDDVASFRDWYGNCVEGTTDAAFGGSIIAWNGVDEISWTALAHEMIHQVRGDGHHTRVDIWGADLVKERKPGTLLGDLNSELIKLGM